MYLRGARNEYTVFRCQCERHGGQETQELGSLTDHTRSDLHTGKHHASNK